MQLFAWNFSIAWTHQRFYLPGIVCARLVEPCSLILEFVLTDLVITPTTLFSFVLCLFFGNDKPLPNIFGPFRRPAFIGGLPWGRWGYRKTSATHRTSCRSPWMHITTCRYSSTDYCSSLCLPYASACFLRCPAFCHDALECNYFIFSAYFIYTSTNHLCYSLLLSHCDWFVTQTMP